MELLNQYHPKGILKDQRFKDIQQYGVTSMAYSALQEGIQEFRHSAFRGFIPYFSLWGIDYVLSDPITPPEDFMGATLLFLNKSQGTVFCQISASFAQTLSLLNFKINGLGVEHVIDLDDFEVTWKKRKRLKSYLSSFSKQDFNVVEDKFDLSKIKEINEQWLKSKSNGRELRFMARPFIDLSEKDVRNFFLEKDDQLLGFVTFDPVYSTQMDQQIESYALQHLRVSELAPSGSQDFLILKALEQFKREGLRKISLGISPLYQRDNEHFKYSRMTEYVFSFFYRMNLFYSYQRMGEHKEQYKVGKNPVYLAMRDEFLLRKLGGLLKVNNLI